MDFKIRCSAIGKIMTEARSKSEPLSKTCITYLEEWTKEQIYDRRKEIDSKYMEKGILMEDSAIDFVSSYYPDLPLLIKNEKNFASDYITGTPDLILDEEVIDIKCSWDCFTFPLFEKELNKDYYWQLQGYMYLTGCSKGRIIYVLIDTPIGIVDREIRFNPDKEAEIIAYHNYRNVPDKYKIKSFEVTRSDQDIDAIIKRVNECREYIKTL